MRPECSRVVAFVMVSCELASPSGPSSFSQERSTRLEAIFCPLFSRLVMLKRCVSGLKYPREMEKLYRGLCFVRMRVWVIFDSSSAITIPRAETTRAVILIERGIVMGGVFVGGMYEVIRSPAIILPKASRVIGEITSGLFSFIGVRGGIRTNPVCTSTVMRIVYTAVNDVASRVRTRAQVFRYEVLRLSMIWSFE